MSNPHEEHAEETPKHQLPAAGGAAEIFGMSKSSTLHEAGPLPSGLPILDASFAEISDHKNDHAPQHPPVQGHEAAHPTSHAEPHGPAAKSAGDYAKMLVPYVAVFLLGIFLYFFYFTNFNLNVSEFFKKADAPELGPVVASAMLDAQEDRLEDYQRWMGQFYFEVNDPNVIDPNGENCACGLTNFEKYLLNLNPKLYSTRGSRMSDGQLVIDGTDPATSQPFEGNRKLIVEQYFDVQLISERITASTLRQFNQNQTAASVPAEEVQVPVTEPRVAGQSQAAPQGTRTPQISATSTVNLSTTKGATLEIPKIGVTVPIIFSKSTKDFDADLVKGAVHYPGTVLPGETGNAYISAHSSALPWVQSPYKSIFARFGELSEGDSFVITAISNEGQEYKLNYVIRSKGIHEANDQAQFINTAKSEVSLSTCWPIGTAQQRYVVRGELTQVER